MDGVSREESKLLIQHAISALKEQDVKAKQKYLASMLGMEESRVSDAKAGKHKLLSSQREIIVQHFGYPRRGCGQYIKAEVYDSVSKFVEDFEEASKKRFQCRLFEIFTNSDYLALFCSHFNLNDDFSVQESPAIKLRCLDLLLEDEQFKEWFDAYFDLVAMNNGPDYTQNQEMQSVVKKIIYSIGLSLQPSSDRHITPNLFLLGLLKFRLMPSFKFSSANTEKAKPNDTVLTEVILTGDIVLEYQDQCRGAAFDHVRNTFGKYDDFPVYYTERAAFRSECNHISQFIHSRPDNWKEISMNLYLSETMHYNLWLRLDSNQFDRNAHPYKRDIVIRNLCRVDYLREIEKIKMWAGLQQELDEIIKSKVAAVGGYVPGAMVL